MAVPRPQQQSIHATQAVANLQLVTIPISYAQQAFVTSSDAPQRSSHLDDHALTTAYCIAPCFLCSGHDGVHRKIEQ
jgi:hypothetical protein